MKTILFVFFFFISILLPAEGEARIYCNEAKDLCLYLPEMTLEQHFEFVLKIPTPPQEKLAKLFEKLKLGKANTYVGKDQKERLERRLATLQAIKDIKTDYKKTLEKIAKKYKLDPDLIRAIIVTETLNNPRVLSSVDAMGLMQVRAIANKDTGVLGCSFDPDINIEQGVAYLALLRDKYKFKGDRMIVAFNEGPRGVKRFSDIKIKKHRYLLTINWVMRNIKIKNPIKIADLI